MLPDEEMPKIEDFAGLGGLDPDSVVNFNIDIICNPLGIINRLNPSQNIEMELNYNSKFIRYQMEQHWGEWTVKEQIKYLLDYINVIDPKEKERIENIFKKLNEEDKEELLEGFIRNGIPIHQPPINGAKNIMDLARVYEYTGVDRTKLYNIENTVIFGEKFMMTLKHTPQSKFSARSVDQLSIKNIPVKSELYKEYKADYSTNAIKVGEMENINLGLANPANKGAMQINKNFLDSHANNEEMRMDLLEAQLFDNPYDFKVKTSETMSENSKILNTFLLCSQLETENDEDMFTEDE